MGRKALPQCSPGPVVRAANDNDNDSVSYPVHKRARSAKTALFLLAVIILWCIERVPTPFPLDDTPAADGSHIQTCSPWNHNRVGKLLCTPQFVVSLAGVRSRPDGASLVESGPRTRARTSGSMRNSAGTAVRVGDGVSARVGVLVIGGTSAASRSQPCERICEELRNARSEWRFKSLDELLSGAPGMFPRGDKVNRCGPPDPVAPHCDNAPWVNENTLTGVRGQYIKHPTTTSSLDSLRSRMRHFTDLDHLNNNERTALMQARGAVCDVVLSAFNCAPNDMHRMLNEYNADQVFRGQCNYICVKPGGISKSGMSMTDCHDRVWEQDQDCIRAFLLDSPSALVAQGLVRHQDIDELYSHAPMFAGYHPTRMKRAKDLIALQLIEASMFGFYNFNDGPIKGPVMEVALKVPSVSEKNLVSVRNNYNNLGGLFGNARFLRIMTLIRAVFFIMTWPPYDSYMQGRADSNRMSCFSFRTPTGPYEVSPANCPL